MHTYHMWPYYTMNSMISALGIPLLLKQAAKHRIVLHTSPISLG